MALGLPAARSGLKKEPACAMHHHRHPLDGSKCASGSLVG
jgi:hypothetical protein